MKKIKPHFTLKIGHIKRSYRTGTTDVTPIAITKLPMPYTITLITVPCITLLTHCTPSPHPPPPTVPHTQGYNYTMNNESQYCIPL